MHIPWPGWYDHCMSETGAYERKDSQSASRSRRPECLIFPPTAARRVHSTPSALTQRQPMSHRRVPGRLRSTLVIVSCNRLSSIVHRLCIRYTECGWGRVSPYRHRQELIGHDAELRAADLGRFPCDGAAGSVVEPHTASDTATIPPGCSTSTSEGREPSSTPAGRCSRWARPTTKPRRSAFRKRATCPRSGSTSRSRPRRHRGDPQRHVHVVDHAGPLPRCESGLRRGVQRLAGRVLLLRSRTPGSAWR